MKDDLKVYLGVTLAAAFLLLVGYTCWNAEKRIRYNFSYRSLVTEQLKPIVDKVTELETKVKVLEKDIDALLKNAENKK